MSHLTRIDIRFWHLCESRRQLFQPLRHWVRTEMPNLVPLNTLLTSHPSFTPNWAIEFPLFHFRLEGMQNASLAINVDSINCIWNQTVPLQVVPCQGASLALSHLLSARSIAPDSPDLSTHEIFPQATPHSRMAWPTVSLWKHTTRASPPGPPWVRTLPSAFSHVFRCVGSP